MKYLNLGSMDIFKVKDTQNADHMGPGVGTKYR